MTIFRTKQEIIDICGVKLGGQPGQLPTVLIGSIFHRGHRIVRDARRGLFNKKKAEHLVRLQDEMSWKTGNPCMVDVYGETLEALTKYLEFVSEVTDAPILLNGATANVRVEAMRYAAEIGLLNRVIYNSLNARYDKQELDVIEELNVKAAVIQAFNPRNPKPEGMLQIIVSEEGLLKKATAVGVEKPLILASVLDMPSVGLAARAVSLIKDNTGLPTGAPPVGVIGRWRKVDEYGLDIGKCRRATAAVVTQMAGADFIIYGSLAKAPYIFPICAMVDVMLGYAARMAGIPILTREHPIYKIV